MQWLARPLARQMLKHAVSVLSFVAWLHLIGGEPCADVKTQKGPVAAGVIKMVKKTVLAVMVGVLLLSLLPSTGSCWHAEPRRHGHGGHGDDALLWGLGGLVLGAAVVGAALQPAPPPPQPVMYVEPQPAAYVYQPRVEPEMCRWERYVLDGYGRTLFDQYGQPAKEYTTGPCQYPPNW